MIKNINYIFSGKDKVKFVFLLCMAILGSFLELLGVSLFSPFVEVLMDLSNIYKSSILSFVYALFDFSDELNFVLALAVFIIIVYVFKNLYLVIEKNFIYSFSYNLQRKISVKLLNSYMRQPYTFHLDKNIAVLQRSLQDDTDLFTKGIIHILELFVEITICVVLGVYLFIVSKSISVIVVGLLVICMGIFAMISKRYSKTIGKECQEHKGKIYQWMNQALGGIKEIKILGREDFFIERYNQSFEKYVRGLRINRLIGVLPKHVVETVCMAGLLLAIIFKILYGQKEIVEYISQLAVLAVAAMKLMPSVGKINEHVSCILYSVPSFELLKNDLKAIEEEIMDEQTEEIRWNFENAISVKDVKYSYPNSEGNVIDGATLEIRKGEAIAFIGPSGAGKTTMVDIILGLLQPQYGRIKADEIDINKHKRMWQNEIGYIPQVIYLSDDTIRNNIAFGINEKEIDEDAVIRALKQAQLFEFVDNLPEGLDTVVGDRGVRLSGGQRQRIGIARALYHNPEVLVLDEATSALDSETESAVMEAINHLQGIKTMIIIAHRLSTIRNVDSIYEVTEGKVVLRSKDEII